MACPEGTTDDGFDMQFGICHVAHFFLFQLLRPLLLASSTPAFNSRVVNVSSLGHRFLTVQLDDLDFKKSGYNPWTSYGQAKTANIWMANEIERRFGGQGLHATSLMPGAILQTNLSQYLSEEDMRPFTDDENMQRVMLSPAQGAATTVWAAVGREWEGKGGKYLEQCRVALPAPEKEELTMYDAGYSPHAYDEAGAKKLWDISCKLTGTEG